MKEPPPIKTADYQRIFRTIYSVLENEGNLGRKAFDLTAACYYFNTIGAQILQEYYGLNVLPVVGVAGYCLNKEPKSLLLFASIHGDVVDFDGENVHCWVRSKDWYIDFTAPLFPELAKKHGFPSCKSKMMSKPLHLAKESLDDLSEAGDFYEMPNVARTERVIGELIRKQDFRDLMGICCAWFEKPPHKMLDSIGIANEEGKISQVRLTNRRIDGSW